MTEIARPKMLVRSIARRVARLMRAQYTMRFPTYSAETQAMLAGYPDEVRYSSLALAIARLEADSIPGAFAEIGVWRGVTSRFMHAQAPHRKLYLFDTFDGFPSQDLNGQNDPRFRDTCEATVLNTIENTANLEVRAGYFPQTANGLESEQFALVMIDVDLYAPTVAALQFFYPRLSRGAYVFMHDFNSPESEWAVSRAARTFLEGKPELLIELPDASGSVVFRKI